MAFCFVFSASSSAAATWYVAPDGSDSNTGTSNSPFATIMKAQSAASFGDTVYLRGGTYYLDNSNFTATNNPWAIINDINKSGISYLAYPGELPVFDFSQTDPGTNRETAFLVTASSCVFKGFDVVGVRVTIQTNHTQSECFRVASTSANFNRFEQLRMHDGMGNGWYLTDGASNVVLNCDAWNNRGLDSGSLGNTDGFGCHPAHTSGQGNIISGCRAWFNSDDGYDCINAFAPVTFDHCWAFYNGYFTNFTSSTGDGNGIKAGGYGANGTNSPGKPLPVPLPRHRVQFSLTVRNRSSGFDANYHVGDQDWLDNTAYRNNVNYFMEECLTDNLTRVPGYDHLMKNNLGFEGNTEVSSLDTNLSNVTFNYFTLPVTVTSNDFVTLDESRLTAPREANGDLPVIAFAQLTNTSGCIDVGTNEGFAFYGAAPDLGAFEFGPTDAPPLTVALSGANLVFAASGWANRTNYLIAANDLAFAPSQWTCVATNESDLAGNCAFTNAILAGVPWQFYRLKLP